MAYMSDRQSVAANASVANVLSGKSQEFLIAPSALDFGIQASAVGMFATIIVGNEILMEDQEVPTQNRMPVFPDDFILFNQAGAPGDRVIVKLRNSTAGAITVFTAVRVNEMA